MLITQPFVAQDPSVTRRVLCFCVIAALSGAATAQSVTFRDDGQVALVALTNAGVQEKPVPLYASDVRVNDPATPGADLFDIINVFDRVSGTGSFPLTFADIIANGYIRPLVQRADGSTGAIGTSVVTSAAFRPAGGSLDLTPTISRVDVSFGGAERFRVEAQGTFGARATLVCSRSYPDPVVGRSDVFVRYTWTAAQDIVMPGVSQGRGNDCFRLIMFSSMLADVPGGVYDANFLGVTDPQGRRRVVALSAETRNAYISAAPRPTAVGGSFELLKDNAATWNAGSPSIAVEIVSVTGPALALGVQGWRLDSTDPNDDSLGVWLEWVNVPGVIASGTMIEATFRVVATPPTDPGDLDHDGDIDCADVNLLELLLGVREMDATFNAYADLDRNRIINAADRDLLVARLGSFPADLDGSGSVNSQDFFAFLGAFFSGSADFNADGVTDSRDFFAYLSAFFGGCA